jgi:TolB-like protein/Tfp pilus assembly protein PilF
MSPDPEQQYFSDGMSEQILNSLSKIPGLRVIARTSSFSFKGKEDLDVSAIAERLNVAYVLEGSVQRSANRVRVTVQLINAGTSSRQWSETYDRELTDIFAVQDEIALAVVNELKLTLLDKGLRARSATTSLEAYNLYLQGRHFSNQATERSLAKAAELYGKALAIDPKYAEAWAELAANQSYSAAMGFGLTNQTVGYNNARASAQKALELDSDLARAHLVLGLVHYQSDWDWSKADVSFKKAMALDPNSPDTLMSAGSLALSLGAHDVAIDLCQKAVALDPLAAISRSVAAWTYWMIGRLDEAEHEIRALLELSPEVASGWLLLGLVLVQKGEPRKALEIMNSESAESFRLYGQAVAYHALGKKEESDAALSALIREYADVAAYQVANVYAYRGERESAFDWLDRAYRQRDSGLIGFNSDPFLATLADDPRYGALLRKLKLPRLPQVSRSSPITRPN